MLDGFTIRQKPRSSLTQRFSSPLRQEGRSPYDKTGLLLDSLSFLDALSQSSAVLLPRVYAPAPETGSRHPGRCVGASTRSLASCLALTLGKIPHTHML